MDHQDLHRAGNNGSPAECDASAATIATILTVNGCIVGFATGGIQGGISNGEDIDLRVSFKPTATINNEQDTVTSDGKAIKLKAKGRHDPCVLPRAVPMVEAMINLVLTDHYLRKQKSCL